MLEFFTHHDNTLLLTFSYQLKTNEKMENNFTEMAFDEL